MRRTNAESPDTFTAKQGFFDRTLAPHTDRLGVSCRVQALALVQGWASALAIGLDHAATSVNGVNEMVRRCHPPLRRSIEAAVLKEDHRHADSLDWHRPG